MKINQFKKSFNLCNSHISFYWYTCSFLELLISVILKLCLVEALFHLFKIFPHMIPILTPVLLHNESYYEHFYFIIITYKLHLLNLKIKHFLYDQQNKSTLPWKYKIYNRSWILPIWTVWLQELQRLIKNANKPWSLNLSTKAKDKL